MLIVPRTKDKDRGSFWCLLSSGLPTNGYQRVGISILPDTPFTHDFQTEFSGRLDTVLGRRFHLSHMASPWGKLGPPFSILDMDFPLYMPMRGSFIQPYQGNEMHQPTQRTSCCFRPPPNGGPNGFTLRCRSSVKARRDPRSLV